MVKMIDNELNWSDEKIADLVAQLCYMPHLKSERKTLAVKWLIEYLVLPPNMDGYTKGEMKNLILKAIKEHE
jgi:hypothetical protein